MSFEYILYLYMSRLDCFVQLLVACALFVFRLPRRRLSPLRIVFCVVTILTVALLTDPFSGYAAVTYLRYFLLLFLTMAAVLFCFKVNVFTMLFCVVNGNIGQFVSYKIYELVTHFTGYAPSIVLFFVIYFSVHVTVFFCVYYLYARKLRVSKDIERNRGLIPVLSVFLFVYLVIFNQVFVDLTSLMDDTQFVFFQLSQVLFGVLVMLLQYFLFRDDRNLVEMEILENMMTEQQAQFERLKDTMDILNIKCHDLKHQIREANVLPEEQVAELVQSINIYDSYADTGNKALNTVVAEKAMLCNYKGISLTYLSDGAALDSMADSDIYSLFGNALDNAIRAVEKLPEGDRVISFTLRRSLGQCVIHFENPYAGEIRFAGAIPQTSQEDTNRHGFGVRSMFLIVGKYGGEMVIGTEKKGEKIFTTDITMPLT